MNGFEAIARILKAEGTEYIFCFPFNLLIEAAAIEGIHPILPRLERTAVNMADGYTRVSNGRRNGVVVTQAGAGIENAFAGVAQAYADGSPILLFPGGSPAPRAGGKSDFPAAANYKGVTKWAERLSSAEAVPDVMRRAFTLLRNGPTAPVLIELAPDITSGDAADALAGYRSVKAHHSGADEKDVSAAVEALLAADRPLIHAGQGVLYAEATDLLVELAELLDAPVMTTTLGKSAFPEDHRLALGAAGVTGTDMIRSYFGECDLILSIGSSVSANLASARLPDGKTLIQCTSDPSDLNRERFIDLGLLGDARIALGQLIAETKSQAGAAGRDAGTANRVRGVKESWIEQWLPLLSSDERPINPYRVIWEVQQTVDHSRTIVTHDSGNPRDHTVPFYEATVPRGYLGWGNSTQLGFSLGVAMGAKLGAPDKYVVNIMGDAAIGMAGIELETAARYSIAITTIVINNAVLSGYSRRFPTAAEKYGLTTLSGDYSKLAEALGVRAEKVTEPDAVRPAIQSALAHNDAGKPALIEIMAKEETTLAMM